VSRQFEKKVDSHFFMATTKKTQKKIEMKNIKNIKNKKHTEP
jgi:hypothetical protein